MTNMPAAERAMQTWQRHFRGEAQDWESLEPAEQKLWLAIVAAAAPDPTSFEHALDRVASNAKRLGILIGKGAYPTELEHQAETARDQAIKGLRAMVYGPESEGQSTS